MARIVIAGAGVGGVPAALEMKHHARKRTRSWSSPTAPPSPSPPPIPGSPDCRSRPGSQLLWTGPRVPPPGRHGPSSAPHRRQGAHHLVTSEPYIGHLGLGGVGDSNVYGVGVCVAIPQIPPRNVTIAKEGIIIHWGKILFEKDFLRKIRKGVATPFYEKLDLRMMG